MNPASLLGFLGGGGGAASPLQSSSSATTGPVTFAPVNIGGSGNKTALIIGAVAVAALAVWYFINRK